MRLSSLLCTLLLAGCASHTAVPAATASNVPTQMNGSVEVRHMYLFAPGKAPVLIVDHEDVASAPQEVSSEPPSFR